MTESRSLDAMMKAASEPVMLTEFCQAGSVADRLSSRSFLHSGPPIMLEEVTGPSRGALIAGLLLEREASSKEEAEEIISAGELSLVSCHEVGGVGALAGVITPHTPVVTATDALGRKSFAPLNEGLGKAVRFGNFDSSTISRLKWMSEVMAPALDNALRARDPIDLIELQAEGLRRGDECHNRNVASGAQFAMQIAPHLVSTSSATTAETVLRELASNVHFFLSLSIAASKLVADRLHDVAIPGVVTAIAANGKSVGIRVSGTSKDWFEAPSMIPAELTFRDGFTREVVNPLLGDSSIVETVGLGASALTSSPVLASRVGIDYRAAERLVSRIRNIALLEHPRYRLPSEDFKGSPFAISVQRVVDTQITPSFSAGFAHRDPGGGPVAAGMNEVPLEVFDAAFTALAASNERTEVTL